MDSFDPMDLEMSGFSTAGLILVVVGGLLLIFDGVNYHDTEHIMGHGPMEVSVRTSDRLPLPDWLGAAGIVVGGVLISFGAIRESRR